MKTLTIFGWAGITRAARCCGSLNAGTAAWDALRTALLTVPTDGSAIYEAAEYIAHAAVPDEGDIHPRRAKLNAEGYHTPAVTFVTPGGVCVTVLRDDHAHPAWGGTRHLTAVVEFGRESRYLAAQMVAQVAFGAPECPVQIDDDEEYVHAYDALCLAAADLAADRTWEVPPAPVEARVPPAEGYDRAGRATQAEAVVE